MPIASYAGLRERFLATDFTVAPNSGGSTTQATSFYYFVYGIARGGINLGTSMGQVNVSSGEKLQFTINATARTSGLQPFGFALGVANTNDETQSKLLAVVWVIGSDQETDVNLPLTIELTKDEDFSIDGTVTAIGDLPTNLVNGAIREVTSESAYYQWDGDGWYGDPGWIKVYGNQLYLASTTTLRSGVKWKGGCDAPIPTIPPDSYVGQYGIIHPPWNGDGDISTPIKLWLLNGLNEGNGIVLPVDSQVGLVATVNDSTELGSSVLSGKINLSVNGIIRRLDGSRVTTVNEDSVWYSGIPFYSLTSQLDRGYALETEYTCSATVGNGDRVTVYLRDNGVYGIPSNNIEVGNAIFAEKNKALIVPDLLGVMRLSGDGFIVTDNQTLGHTFITNGEVGLTQGIIVDTAGQKIVISGIQNGAIACRQSEETLLPTEKVRAVISTESGTATASDWSSPVTVGANGRLEVTIALPSAIRSNYPDILIAGNGDGERVIPQMKVFVRLSGVITELSSVVVEYDNDQVLIIDDLSSGSVVGSLPSNGDTSFNLWGYGIITPVSTGVGSLVAGDYEVAIAWDYPSPNLVITKISHDRDDGCIPTLVLSFADAIALANVFSQLELEGVSQPQRKILDVNTRLVEITDDPSSDRLRLDFPEVGRVVVRGTDPTSTDDSDSSFRVGDIIVNTVANPTRFFIASSVAVASASWTDLGGGGTGNGITAIANLATLKALTGVADDASYLLKTNSASGLANNIYRYDSGSSATGNDNTIIVPDTLPGRFLKVGSFKSSEITEESDKYFASAAQLAAIATNTSGLANKADAIHNHLTVKGGLLAANGTNMQVLPVGTNGQILAADSGATLGISWADPPNAITTNTTASYTQPQVDATVVITFGSTANFVSNQTHIVIETGGRYLITAIASSTTATAKYLGGGANPTVQIETDRKVSLTGASGTDGASSVTTVLTDFVIPAISSTETIEVGSADGINLNSYVNIATGGEFKVTSKDDGIPNTITIENLGGNNTAAGVTISTGSQIVISGSPGPTGSVSATSSVTYSSAIPPPSTGSSEWKEFFDSTNSNKKSLREPNDGNVRVFAFLSDILPTVLTGFSLPLNPTEILPTDTLLESIGKAQKYFTDFLSNFNGANQLLRLGVNGEIPKLDGRNITQTYLYQVTIATVKNGTFRLLALPPGTISKSTRIDGIHDIKSGSNTGTISVRINGTDITGLDNISIDQTGTNYTSNGSESNKTIDPQQDFEMVLTNGSPTNPMTNLSFTIYGVYNP